MCDDDDPVLGLKDPLAEVVELIVHVWFIERR